MTRVVLVRPWTDAHAGSGCCSGDARHGVCLERHEREPVDRDVQAVGETFRRLRTELPDLDVQVVAASNTAYLLPTVYRFARARVGRLAALRQAARSTTAGAVLVDGQQIGHLEALGVDGVLQAVRAHLVSA